MIDAKSQGISILTRQQTLVNHTHQSPPILVLAVLQRPSTSHCTFPTEPNSPTRKGGAWTFPHSLPLQLQQLACVNNMKSKLIFVWTLQNPIQLNNTKKEISFFITHQTKPKKPQILLLFSLYNSPSLSHYFCYSQVLFSSDSFSFFILVYTHTQIYGYIVVY